MWSPDPQRPRRIVELAAGPPRRVGHSWLYLDERGTWEKTAEELLERTAQRVVELKMTERQVDREIATGLQCMAIEVMICHAKKHPTAAEVVR